MHSIARDLTFFVGTWAIPKGFFKTYYLAAGNSTSCSVQAFFAEASLGVFAYVGAICMCSYCAVKHDYKEESYERFEKISHVLCTLIPLCLALVLVSMGLQAPDGGKYFFLHKKLTVLLMINLNHVLSFDNVH